MTVCDGVKFIRLHTYKYAIGKMCQEPIRYRHGVKVEPSLRRCEGMKRTLKGCFMHFIPSWRRAGIGHCAVRYRCRRGASHGQAWHSECQSAAGFWLRTVDPGGGLISATYHPLCRRCTA